MLEIVQPRSTTAAFDEWSFTGNCDDEFASKSIRTVRFTSRPVSRVACSEGWTETRTFAREKLAELGLLTIQNIDQTVETLSGGQRQGIAVVRTVAFGPKVAIMEEPTAALGVRKGRRVLDLIRDVKERGMPIMTGAVAPPKAF